MRRGWPALVVAFALVTPEARSQDAAECAPEVAQLDRYQYLRALSLDLRGVVPTVEEYEALDDLDDVPSEWIEEWMQTAGFGDRVVRRHRELVWPSVGNVRLVTFRRRFRTTDDRWWRGGAARAQRGDSVPCLDEPVRYGPGGEILTELQPDGTEREGWVMVRPYWAPDTEIKVCAFDAQEQRYSPSGRDCAHRSNSETRECGCGPNLRWCDTGSVHNQLTASLAEDVERRIAANVVDGEPYHRLLTGRRAFVNGPLVFYWKNLTLAYDSVPLVPEPIDTALLPDLEFTDRDTWVEVELPESHAGILTSPVYLLRFQTNRARAARFYDAFLCQPFQPPPGGIPVDDELASLQPDVQQRPGCNYCHALLEPAAAHWGRWTQQGGGYLDPAEYPTFRAECADCARGFEACSSTCSLHYVTRAVSPEEEEYLGMLRSHEFLRPAHEGYIDDGPARLVREGLGDGSLTECAVRRAASWLLHRETRANEELWLRDLEDTLVGGDFAYRDLVRAVVTSDTYRRVR